MQVSTSLIELASLIAREVEISSNVAKSTQQIKASMFENPMFDLLTNDRKYRKLKTDLAHGR